MAAYVSALSVQHVALHDSGVKCSLSSVVFDSPHSPSLCPATRSTAISERGPWKALKAPLRQHHLAIKSHSWRLLQVGAELGPVTPMKGKALWYTMTCTQWPLMLAIQPQWAAVKWQIASWKPQETAYPNAHKAYGGCIKVTLFYHCDRVWYEDFGAKTGISGRDK